MTSFERAIRKAVSAGSASYLIIFSKHGNLLVCHNFFFFKYPESTTFAVLFVCC
jgi:hypothetical protein